MTHITRRRLAAPFATLLTLGALVAGVSTGASAAPVTVFSDDFEDGNVADWSVSSSANIGTPVVTVRSDSTHAGSAYALHTYFDAPGGGSGAGFVHASRQFDLAWAGDFTLDLWARSSPCSGCTMFFDVLLDGVSLWRDGSSPTAFVQRSVDLSGLTAGLHTLTLGMYTNAASSGRFNASFDDVRLTGEAPVTANDVPEPATGALVASALAAITLLRRRRPARG